jgi:hypothetical protein
MSSTAADGWDIVGCGADDVDIRGGRVDWRGAENKDDGAGCIGV